MACHVLGLAQVLIAAAAVSLIIGIIKDPHEGWIEGTAIVIASKSAAPRTLITRRRAPELSASTTSH